MASRDRELFAKNASQSGRAVDARISDLSSDKALITAASSCLGELFLHVLAKAGACILTAGRRAEERSRDAMEMVVGRCCLCAVRIKVADCASIEETCPATLSIFGQQSRDFARLPRSK